MLTSKDVEEIRRGIEGGTRGPVLLKWVRLLLEDYEARTRRLIDCPLCRGFQPIVEDEVGGHIDVLCGKCRHACATLRPGP
jgi:hypothetical protein